MKEFGFDKMICHVNIVVFAIYLSLVSPTFAQSGGPYELSWSTIDGGGGTSAGGSYTLAGTIGQPDAASGSGGKYELLGGFWLESFQYLPIGDFCGPPGSPEPDGYVDYWDLLYFAQRWHSSPSDTNWDPRCDLDKEDNYVDYWDLLVFAQNWHTGEPP